MICKRSTSKHLAPSVSRSWSRSCKMFAPTFVKFNTSIKFPSWIFFRAFDNFVEQTKATMTDREKDFCILLKMQIKLFPNYFILTGIFRPHYPSYLSTRSFEAFPADKKNLNSNIFINFSFYLCFVSFCYE